MTPRIEAAVAKGLVAGRPAAERQRSNACTFPVNIDEARISANQDGVPEQRGALDFPTRKIITCQHGK